MSPSQICMNGLTCSGLVGWMLTGFTVRGNNKYFRVGVEVLPAIPLVVAGKHRTLNEILEEAISLQGQIILKQGS